MSAQIGSRQLRSSSVHYAEKRRISKADVDVEMEIKIMEKKRKGKKGGGNGTIKIKFNNFYLINKKI